ncbi:MBL fold metallo-hydrolase [Moraxella ovis]|uniref:MBL fold metallo-hydrolase n=1 Tax=Moraxella ovis TaxID=29433 RepID=UPI000D9D3B3C|nr:MBL fold metallo-hydrolase [Moraxella ovis]SPX81679.1 Ribonuclease Z [Moraxella ovis]STZ05836.1 Ribonuclease Z [Moraxella ovis]
MSYQVTKGLSVLAVSALSLSLMVCSTTSVSSQSAVQANPEYLHAPSTHPARLAPKEGEMRVTLLGTGSPVPSVHRYGPATLVQAGDLNILIDAGRGNAVRLTQAGVPLGKIDAVFFTHYHSDHTNGLGDLWMTGYIPAFGGRSSGALNVYGPTGAKALVEGLKIAHADDIKVRVADGELKAETTGLVAHEFEGEGVVFNQNGVVITAFDVPHDTKGAIKPNLGYRVDYAGRSVLISGDTIPSPNVIKYGKGVDLLIHEVAEFKDINALPQVYAHHTNPRQAGEIFSQTKPKMAVYTHVVNGVSAKIIGIPDEELIERTRANYQGALKVGRDLMSFSLNANGVEVYEP